MAEFESLSDSIRRKVSEKKAEAQRSMSECDTTEVSASQMQLRQSATVANLGLRSNPLLPMCIALSLAVLILSTLLFLSHLGH